MDIRFQILDPDPKDNCGATMGFVVVTINAFMNDKKVGYLKISYIPRENWVDDILYYANRFKGWSFDEKTLKGIGPHIGILDDRPISREMAEQAAHDHFDEYMKQSYEFHVDKPMIDFVTVEESKRRQGIGTKLYLKAAEWCQSKGLFLHASGLQTDLAKAVWNKLKQRSDCVVRKSGDRLTIERTVNEPV